MAKPTNYGETYWQTLLAAAVIEFGTRRAVGPYRMKIPARALRAVTPRARWEPQNYPTATFC